MAKAGLDVGEAVVLVGRRAQRLGQHGVAGDPQRQLAAAGHEGQAVDADQITEIEVEQALHALGAKLVNAGLELDPARTVLEVQERHLALPAARGQPPGHPVADVGLVPGLQVVVGRPDVGDRLDPAELVRERVDPRLAERAQLAPARGEQV